MRFLTNLKIRTKFLLVPTIAAGSMVLLGGLALHFFVTQKATLFHVMHRDLVKIDQLTQVFSRLSTNHVQIFDLLAAADTGVDEEQLYESGKPKLYHIHTIVSEINGLADRLAFTDRERRIHHDLTRELREYRAAAITAIEMASVDVSLATHYMIKANASYSDVNTIFALLLRETRADVEFSLTHALRGFKRMGMQFGVVLGLTIMSTVSITVLLANLLSGEIMSMINIMATLAMGDRSVAVPHIGRHDEIGTMAQALHIFKQNMIQLAASEAHATEINQRLVEEIRERQRAQEALYRVNVDLEERVARRTADLQCANAQLQAEITERRLLEGQLVQAQKLESIGQLAAGIAHEINTPTQFIGNNTRFLQNAFADLYPLLKLQAELVKATDNGGIANEWVAQTRIAAESADLDFLLEELPTAIEQSLDGVERVSKIVLAMKEFSHPSSVEKQAVDLNKAIENTITVSRSEWKYVAEMETDFDPTLPLVPCLPGEFNQVVLNMIVNAAHAIAAATSGTSDARGTLTISTRQAGEWAEIRISDTGIGIPVENCPKIFDPFFTTKEVGKGAGQGLAIAHSVIKDKHGGTIEFESAVGKGTTFLIRLPLPVSTS